MLCLFCTSIDEELNELATILLFGFIFLPDTFDVVLKRVKCEDNLLNRFQVDNFQLFSNC